MSTHERLHRAYDGPAAWRDADGCDIPHPRGLTAQTDLYLWMLAPEQRDWRWQQVDRWMGRDLACDGKGYYSICPVEWVAQLCRLYDLWGWTYETAEPCPAEPRSPACEGRGRLAGLVHLTECETCETSRVGFQGVLL